MATMNGLKLFGFQYLCCLVLVIWVQHGVAYERGDIVARAGIALIDGQDDVGSATLAGAELGEFGVRSVTLPIANVSYFFSDHFAVEMLVGKPPTFEIYGTSGAIEDSPIGTVEAFPLVVYANYYPMRAQSRWQPHVGLGLNYVISGDSSVDPELESRFGADSVDITGIDNSLGLVVALGLDYMLTPNVMLAVDAYYLDVKAEAQIEVLINDQIYAAQLSGRTGRAPILYALTLGYRF